jgi:TonB family protein
LHVTCRLPCFWWFFEDLETPASPTQPAAQTTTAQSVPAKVEMPSDPAALLELAAKKNGLRSVIVPWHLKATYEVLDEKGGTKDEGTFEEFWVSANKYRSSYSSSSFNQTSIASEKGLYTEGDTGTPRGPASLVRSTLFNEAPFSRDKAKVNLRLDDRTLGSVALKCVTIETKTLAPNPPTVIECLDNHLPVVLITVRANGLLQTLHSEIVLFDGVYIARTIEVKNESKTILRVHIDMLEPYATTDEALFAASPGAVYSPLPVPASSAVTAGNIVSKVTPRYPASAKQQGIQGTVVLHAVITREGKISAVEPVIGPPELIPGAVDAVKQWQYRPYLLNGVPVEVETEINVVFCLSCR